MERFTFGYDSKYNSICRKLVVYDEWSSITIHVALDNALVINDVGK